MQESFCEVRQMKVVALVPIKLNSQRVPKKNLRDLGGRPLLWHVCHTLTMVQGIDEVCVYCSSDEVEQFLPESVRYVKRPAWLDENEVRGAQIYEQFISQVDADFYVLAHTTSPFLSCEAIERGVAAIRSGEYDSAFTAQRIQTFALYEGKPLNYELTDVPRTQDMEPVWVETSGFYMFSKDLFMKEHRRIGHRPLIVEVTPIEAIDIDEPQDFAMAEAIAASVKGGML